MPVAVGLSDMQFFWLVFAIVLLVIEGFTVNLYTSWFAGGALAALIPAGFGAHVWVQWLVFAVVTVLLLYFIKPLIKRWQKTVATNVDSKIGSKAVVTKEFDELGVGEVKSDGLIWKAVSSDKLTGGDLVEILRIEGVKLIVRKTS